MSVIIRVSYSTEKELVGVIRLLSPAVKSWKVAKRQKGQYKLAYISLKNVQNGGAKMLTNADILQDKT